MPTMRQRLFDVIIVEKMVICWNGDKLEGGHIVAPLYYISPAYEKVDTMPSNNSLAGS